MNKYESVIIVNPNVDEAGLKALAEGAFKQICDEISTFDKNAELYKFNEISTNFSSPKKR